MISEVSIARLEDDLFNASDNYLVYLIVVFYGENNMYGFLHNILNPNEISLCSHSNREPLFYENANDVQDVLDYLAGDGDYPCVIHDGDKKVDCISVNGFLVVNKVVIEDYRMEWIY